MLLRLPPRFVATPFIPPERLAELRVSSGVIRYSLNENEQLLGLHLADTELTDDELRELLQSNDTSALEILHIARNSLTRLDFIDNVLPSLKFLDARGNKSLITTDLSGCSQLEKVVLRDCALSKLILPKALPNLIQLEVANNILTELPLTGSVEKLRFLDVFNNKLIALPTALAEARDDFYLLAHGNGFDEFITGILLDKKFTDEQRREELKKYLKKLNRYDAKEIYTTRLIFLGNTQVGKTSLADLLTGEENADRGSTHGVNIQAWDFQDEDYADPTKVISIDFGGQDYYHSVHFSLFSKAAIYLLLWGNGQPDAFERIHNKDVGELDDIYPIDYWLGAVKYFMDYNATEENIEKGWKGDALNLYMVHNQNVHNGKRGEIRPLNNKKLIEIYGVDDFLGVCLKEGRKTQREKEKRSIEQLISKHRIKRKRAKLYVDLENAIEAQKKNSEVMMRVDELTEKEKIFLYPYEVSEVFTFLAYSITCHYLGEFQDDDANEEVPFRTELTDYLIIDLNIFTKWMYSILNINVLRNEKGGYFQRYDAEIWLPEKAKMHLNYMLGFMLHHKIIFVVKDQPDRYVVPQYLKPLVPKSVDALFLGGFDAPMVKYSFENYFHSNILAELIGSCYDFLLQSQQSEEVVEVGSPADSPPQVLPEAGWKYVMWKNKVVLYNEKETTKRFLLLEFQLPLPSENSKDEVSKPTITLSRYAKEQVEDVFVQDIIKNIEKTIKYYEYTKLVMAPNGEYIPFNVLDGAKARIAESGYKGTFENQRESYLVFYDNYVYRRGDFKLYLPNEKITMKKIFISYSQHDELYKDELKKHLVTLIHENKVSTFDDRQLSLGGEWDSELKRKIDECDIMVCLISVDFLNTGYIMKTEVPRALEMGKTVVPIVVRPCDWTESMLGVQNGVLKGKEISLFEEKNDKNMPIFRSSTREERDMLWLNVVKGFRAKAFVNEE
ncbi:TIR domain-containing protein [Salmonirosea aquatica]